jgi:MoxR-like ATPase
VNLIIRRQEARSIQKLNFHHGDFRTKLGNQSINNKMLRRNLFLTQRRSISSTVSSGKIRIGNVERALGPPIRRPDLAATHFLPSNSSNLSPALLAHFQWMLQKDNLAQDMLLIGPPGAHAAYRRNLALSYAELLQREAQVVTITSDLTESDLKQRRELVVSNREVDFKSLQLSFVNAAPVDAAIHGRILILDGLEKASRNVLPTLNNLLEHRSMNLEDGTFLIPSSRYDKLDSPPASLIPVHPDFRVIATAVPAPLWPGRALDPPLRSRFQIRRIEPTADDIFALLENKENVEQWVRFVMAMEEAAKKDPGKIWPFPMNQLISTLEMLELFQMQNKKHVFLRAYPIGIKDERLVWSSKHESSLLAFETAWKRSIKTSGAAQGHYTIQSIERSSDDTAEVTFTATSTDDSWFSSSQATKDMKLCVQCGNLLLGGAAHSRYVLTDALASVLDAMFQSHACGKDILLMSPQGESKSATAMHFASLLGYSVKLVHAYPEMTLADLFLRRVTDTITGETSWEPSALLDAIRNGDLCVLDNVEKLRSDVLASLQSLCLDRDVFLRDGRRIMRADRASKLDQHTSNVICVHPSFRLLALASISKEAGSNWLSQDVVSMFSSILIPSPSTDCTLAILGSINPDCPKKTVDKLMALRDALTEEVAGDCGVSPLSTRNLIRIARRVTSPSSIVHDIVCEVLVADLLPPTQRSVLESVLKSVGIQKERVRGAGSLNTKTTGIVVEADKCTIGDFSLQRLPVNRPELVPAPKFYDIPSHVNSIKDLLEDWTSGERAFLVLGNQGVGKNMVIDRLCEVANFEREYIQLHRDSTIGQLTLQPSLEGGRIVWRDSPMVRAVEQGLSLVVDEADKAPTEVLAVLKGLVEDGELLLGDGRRISRHMEGPGIIKMHPNFTLWVLANRPGFPFLGNAFFKLIGDCFSTRVISNPDIESEVKLLQSYGPNVDERLLRSIAGSFAELRSLSDRGDISYPYSTREAVAVIKHLEKFPNDNLISILHNVLNFDSYDTNVYGILGKVFQRHGIPVQSYDSWRDAVLQHGKNLEIEFTDRRGEESTNNNPPALESPKFGKWDDKNEAHVGGNQWAGGTGGSNTAGLGGRGGPYRLDRGHKVHQVSDEKKAEVGQEAKATARAMAEKALKEKLAEINMSDSEWDMYQQFKDPIQGDVASLRAILNQLDIKQSETGWIKRQSHGELDDGKLVDGVTGDSHIYKRRGRVDDSGPMQQPKRLRFVVDVSGSMYRFNGYDKRLIRCLEATNLIMEAFDGMQNRFEYSIVGHSGDSPTIPFIKFGAPPKNEKDRMRILQAMIAHSQYCESGDNTLEAMQQSIADVARDREDDHDGSDAIVIGISDANLERYGIHPRQLGRIIEAGSEKHVKAYCIFIASLGRDADEIKRELPVGRGHVCMQTSELPRVVKNILAANL